ncbi:MAG: hypothetical protein O7G85_01585 [Planctomycetota bacterium]|nr:hypothetical protein [Planctomycetota bacterium]
MTPLHEKIADLFYPLTDFYASHEVPPPTIEQLDGESMPMPYRDLLVHEQDMTSKLEAYWGTTLKVKVLEKHEENSQLTRQVVLVTEQGLATEFGAIRINLDQFEPPARAEILACDRPLGALLKAYDISYVCRPNAYFSFVCDEIASRAFELGESHLLYGRHNLLLNDDEALLAEVVEILPPLNSEAASK